MVGGGQFHSELVAQVALLGAQRLDLHRHQARQPLHLRRENRGQGPLYNGKMECMDGGYDEVAAGPTAGGMAMAQVPFLLPRVYLANASKWLQRVGVLVL